MERIGEHLKWECTCEGEMMERREEHVKSECTCGGEMMRVEKNM